MAHWAKVTKLEKQWHYEKFANSPFLKVFFLISLGFIDN